MGVLDWRGGGLLRPSIRLPDGEERMRAEIPQFSQFAQPPLPLFVSRVWGGGQQWGTKPEPKPAAPHSPLSPSLPPPPPLGRSLSSSPFSHGPTAMLLALGDFGSFGSLSPLFDHYF